MSSSKLGRRSSARSRPRWEKASRQTMPLSNSCMPLMIVWRFQPSSCSARRWPPQPRSFTVRAMKSRRPLPLKVRAVSVRWRLPSSVSRMVLDLQCQGGGLLYGAFFSCQVPYTGAPALTGTRLADYVRLTSPRLCALALLTVATGAVLASGGTPDWRVVAHALVGAALVAAGASALNQ